MKAMILAAGLGSRMRPLTDHTPKPLLKAGGKPLIAHHIEALVAAGFIELVINVSHLGQQIIDYCGDGRHWGAQIVFSEEPEPLETAGGIQRALPMLGAAPFAIVNGDVWTDFPLASLAALSVPAGEAHLVLVESPPQHPDGDFLLDSTGRVAARPPGVRGFTYSGLGVYSPAFFATVAPGKLPLRTLLDKAILEGRLGGEYFEGEWEDIGTPERLDALDLRLRG